MSVTRIRARPTPKKRGMNKWEERYSTILQAMWRAGQLKDWRYEGVTLRLGHDCRYTPDFLLVNADGTVELHEVKGFRRDDSMVKIRAAAAAWPYFRFVLVELVGGNWQSTEVRV